MSNLSDLLPAGASAKQITATDSGSGIASKAPVIMNASGTVSAISGSSSTVGSETQVQSSAPNGAPQVCATTGGQAVAFVDDSITGEAYVLTGSGSSITKSTSSYEYSSALVYSISCCYDSANDKVIVGWMNFSNPTRVQWIRVGTVSGTGASASISWGTAVNFANPTTYTGENRMIYDPDTGNVCIAYYNNTTYLTATCGTVSGTNITMGTPVVLASVNVASSNLVYDPSADRVVFTYEKDATTFNSRVGQMSGSGATATVTLGTEQTILSGNVGTIFPVYDPDNVKVCVAYIPNSTGALDVVVGTVDGSANSITWGTPATVQAAVDNLEPTGSSIAADYDENINKMVVTWRQNPSPYYSYMQGVTITGTTPSAGTNTVIASYSSQLKNIDYDSTLQLSYCVISNGISATVPSLLIAPESSNLTAQAFVGVADSAISASAAGSVIVQGGTVGGITSGTGPSAGANSIFAPNPDDPYRYSMCYDTANDKVIIAYNDEANSYYLYACVGTVTGNAISWGTVVAVDETATMDQIQLTYDTNADRVLLVFRDSATGGDLSGRVGTVSGTTISFGSKTTGTPHPSSLTSIYDPTEQKHLLSYLDNNNSNYGYSCVATVTGGATNTVAFGTQVQFSSDGSLSGDNLPMCYYTSETKIIMKYDITSTGRYAVACTISGTSVSFGTAVLEYAWGTYGQMNSTNITYDSTANKAVSVDGVHASPHALYAAVISLSGTTITWGTPVVVNANSATDNFKHAASIAYSSAGNNFLIAYSDDSNSSYLYGVSGTLSGTSTTWGTPVAVRSVSVASDQETDLIYDPDSQNFVVAYRTATPAGESNVVSIGDLPLTVGTKYYVTPTGGFSSSAGTPSVNAGLAISTTSLLLNGDS